MSSSPKGKRVASDEYNTPPGVAQQLVNLLPIEPGDTVIEPSCGRGHFALFLMLKGAKLHCVELNEDPAHACYLLTRVRPQLGNFLELPQKPRKWCIGNPPYSLAIKFIIKALEENENVCFLLRLSFFESIDRNEFWQKKPAHMCFVLPTRPSFTGKGADSCAYAWFWWKKDHKGTTQLQVLPCQ